VYHAYYYSLSRKITLVSFPPIKHVLFYSGLPLDVGFEIDLKVDLIVQHSDINPVMLKD
jgi:hypothetical protein